MVSGEFESQQCVENRKNELNKKERKEYGKKCQENGFTEKLLHELEAMSSGNLAYAHFAGSLC